MAVIAVITIGHGIMRVKRMDGWFVDMMDGQGSNGWDCTCNGGFFLHVQSIIWLVGLLFPKVSRSSSLAGMA
jgi:hypothetical protein